MDVREILKVMGYESFLMPNAHLKPNEQKLPIAKEV